ncbi:MAG: Glycerol dehydrogenase [Thermodesulfobacteriota bacterium]|nr:Glycerol dehydrogenase [Thermodesulfobacteriota bacterium]
MIRKAIFPGCYLQGKDILRNLGGIEELEKKRVFILATNMAVNRIIPENLSAWKRICDINYEKFSGACTWDEINRVLKIAEGGAYDFIIGMGGGKTIDTARVVARQLGVKYIAAPTIAATDAPTASACVVYSNEGSVVDYFTTSNPDYVLVDTRIIAEAPARFLVSGMGDALATWFEAETCDRSHFRNVCGGFNLRAIMSLADACYQTLLTYGSAARIACENNLVSPALECIVEANTLLSGLGFESGGLSTAHGIHDCLCNLEGTHAYYHGEKVAFGTLAGLFLEARPQPLIDEVYAFCRSVGLPTTLKQIGLEGVTNRELDAAIHPVFENKQSYLHNVRFELTPEGIIEALRMADALGHQLG